MEDTGVRQETKTMAPRGDIESRDGETTAVHRCHNGEEKKTWHTSSTT